MTTTQTSEVRAAWILQATTGAPPLGMTIRDLERAATHQFDAWLDTRLAATWEDGALAAGIPIDQDTLDANNPYRRQA